MPTTPQKTNPWIWIGILVVATSLGLAGAKGCGSAYDWLKSAAAVHDAEVVAPPAPVDVSDQPFNCSNAHEITSDLEGNGTREKFAVIPLNGGASALYVEGIFVSSGTCYEGANDTVTNGDISGLCDDLQRRISTELPTGGIRVTEPLMIWGLRIRFDLGSADGLEKCSAPS